MDGFSFTKGLKVLKVPGTGRGSSPQTRETFLFDLENDYGQMDPVQDSEVEERMIHYMLQLMQENDAPEPIFVSEGCCRN